MPDDLLVPELYRKQKQAAKKRRGMKIFTYVEDVMINVLARAEEPGESASGEEPPVEESQKRKAESCIVVAVQKRKMSFVGLRLLVLQP